MKKKELSIRGMNIGYVTPQMEIFTICPEGNFAFSQVNADTEARWEESSELLEW